MKRAAAFGVILLGLVSAPAFATDTVYYYYNDAQGSPVAVTDAHGNVIERTQYAPYGQVLNRPEHEGPGYTGHEEDPATGLTNMQQRYDDKAVGRTISTDPVDVDPTTGANFNRYAYASDNPYRFVDPDGRTSVADDKTEQKLKHDEQNNRKRHQAEAGSIEAQFAGSTAFIRGGSASGSAGEFVPANGSGGMLGPYASADDAAKGGLAAAGPLGHKYEYGGAVVKSGSDYYATVPATSHDPDNINLTLSFPKADELEAIYHTHTPGSYAPDYFSRNDVQTAQGLRNGLGATSYIGVYDTHSIRYFDPRSMSPITQRNVGSGMSFVGMAHGDLLCTGCFP